MAEGKAPQEGPCQALAEIFQDLQQLHNQVDILGRLFPEVSHQERGAQGFILVLSIPFYSDKTSSPTGIFTGELPFPWDKILTKMTELF